MALSTHVAWPVLRARIIVRGVSIHFTQLIRERIVFIVTLFLLLSVRLALIFSLPLLVVGIGKSFLVAHKLNHSSKSVCSQIFSTSNVLLFPVVWKGLEDCLLLLVLVDSCSHS